MGQKVSKEFESLIKASAAGDINEVQAAIEAGADVNRKVDLEGKRKCTRRRHKGVPPLILEGDTPLHVALRNSGNIDCMKLLINAGADVNIGAPLYAAVSRHNNECVKLLIEAGADVNTLNHSHGTPLLVAVRLKNVECAKMLIDAGADVNKVRPDDVSPLYVAVHSRNIHSVRMLIEVGADVNKTKPGHATPLCAAVAWTSTQCLRLLLGAGADVNSGDVPHLWFAVFKNNIEGLKLLIEAGADVNTNTPPGRNPLITAVNYNKIECVKLLTEAGADVNREGKLSEEKYSICTTPLELAISHTYVECLKILNAGNLVQVKASGVSLRNNCRKVIRRHLLSINKINLFVRVPQLPLPAALKSYLLYDVTLDEELSSL